VKSSCDRDFCLEATRGIDFYFKNQRKDTQKDFNSQQALFLQIIIEPTRLTNAE
jgi:hypothetical protein